MTTIATNTDYMVGRVLRASTRGFTCGTQSNRVDARHDFGALVMAPIANDESVHVIGLTYAVEIKDDALVSELVMADQVDSNVLRDQRENRMVPLEISDGAAGDQRDQRRLPLCRGGTVTQPAAPPADEPLRRRTLPTGFDRQLHAAAGFLPAGVERGGSPR